MRSRLSVLLVIVAVIVAVGSACTSNPSESASQAVVGEATQPTTTAKPAAGAVSYTFSNADSKVEFVGAKVTRHHDGGFKTFSGTVQVPDGAIDKSSISVEIDTASIFSDEEKLTSHLKSPDFFDVAQFPKARFTSTSIVPNTSGGATHSVTGNLEMHGITKAVTFPAKIRLTDAGAEADAEFGINRKDWNIVYPGMPDDLIKDDILIKLAIRAKRG